MAAGRGGRAGTVNDKATDHSFPVCLCIFSGDVAFELGFIVTALVYLPARWVEKRLTGR